MKRTSTIVAASLVALFACNKEGVGAGTLSVRCSYEVTQEALTKAGLSDAVKRIDYLLVQGGEVVRHVEQMSTSQDFGCLELNVGAGTYDLYLFAHNGTSSVTINEDATISIDRVTDSFSSCEEVVINRSARSEVHSTLTRCTARLCLLSTDVAEGAAKFKIVVSGASKIYDIKQHKGTYGQSVESSIVSLSGAKLNAEGKLDTFINVMIPGESVTDATVELLLYDNNESVVNRLVYNDIPLTQNKQTILKAAMFHDLGADAAVTINTEWGEDITVDL